MTLDATGILIPCSSCGTSNRLKYGALERATQCGKCHAALPFPAEAIDAPNAQLFDAAISQSSIPVVVDFWAVWCGPCHMMAPEIDKVAQRTAGRSLVLKVDTDANPELSQRYQIRGIPTIIVFTGGKEATRASGVQPAANIERMIGQFSPA
ncbi:MAG TPA: thioredoxin [Vicinamibacterales bacterium]|nr:thioredoxin [Vicinamibacterales bacterium]